MRPSTKFKTVAAWANALGSHAKTRSGQRKAIISSFSSAFAGRPAPSALLARHWTAAKYLADRERYRQERFANNHPLTRSWPRPATREQVQGTGRECPLDHLQVNVGYARVGYWYVRVVEEADYDYNYYAKSYGHPKKTVTRRAVLVRSIAHDGTLLSRDIDVESFRGSYLLNALVEAGITLPQVGAKFKNVRLHDAYNAQLVRPGRLLQIYDRTIAGMHVDFCAVSNGVTYHASTIREAVAGLRSKIRSANLRRIGAIIDYKFCRELGFCDAGITQFAQVFELDVDRPYTAREIAERVKGNLPAAAPFANELNTLANAVNYQIAP